MKLRNLFASAVVAAFALAGCQEAEQDLGTPDIAISTNELKFEVEGGEQTLTVNATRDWKVETDADWVVVDPESGEASSDDQTVTVTVLENTGMDRSADLKFTIGMKSKYLTVSQAGPGGSPEALIIYANDLDGGKVEKIPGANDYTYWPYPDQSDVWRNEKGTGIDNLKYTSKDVSIRSVSSTNNFFFPAAKTDASFSIQNLELGSATSLQLTFDASHGATNGYKKTFSNEEFKVYVSKDNAKWVELSYDLVVKSDNEFDEATARFTVADTDKLSIGFKHPIATEDGYRLTNIVLSVYGGQDATAIDFSKAVDMDFGTVVDSGSGSNPGTGDLPEGTGEGTLDSPYDAAKATKVASALADGETETEVYVKGVVKSFKDVSGIAQYGNISYYITDADGAANFLVFRGNYLDNAKFTSEDQLKIGDEVVVYGNLINYMGNTPELAQGNYIVSLNGSTGGNPGSGETPTPPAGGSLMTIAEVLASSGNLASGSTIEAVVISNMALNNLTSKKGLYVQDETAGLQFYLAANHEFAFGDKLSIDLSGVSLGEYNGAVQISGLALDKITKISSGNTVEAKTVTIEDFLANKYEGQYVAIEGVQVASADLSKTFVMGDSHTSITVENADGKTFAIFSSKYATYGTTTVPQGSGTIKGISSISKGAMQIIFAQESDFAGLTGERFDSQSGEQPGDGGAEEPVTPPTPPTGDATVAKLVMNTLGLANAEVVDGKEIKVDDNITLVFKKASSGTAPAYYNASQGIRMYQNGATLDVTAAAGRMISSIKLTFDYQQWYIAADSGTLSAEGDVRTWTGSANAVKFTSTGTDKNHRAYIKEIEVTYY